MLVELMVNDGGPLPRTVVLDVTQVKIRQRNGTLIAVAAEMPGMPSAQLVSKVGDSDFPQALKQLGIKEVVDVQRLNADLRG